MSLLDRISQELILHSETHLVKPEWLYIQRHQYNILRAELERATGMTIDDTTMLFGLNVVWVQHDAHPLVRVC